MNYSAINTFVNSVNVIIILLLHALFFLEAFNYLASILCSKFYRKLVECNHDSGSRFFTQEKREILLKYLKNI